MSFKKRILSLAAVGMIGALSLVGCGEKDAFVGTWAPSEITENGNSITADTAQDILGTSIEDFMTIEFKDDGNATVKTNIGSADSKDGTWEVKDGNADLTVDGDTVTIKKDGDDKLVLDKMPGSDDADIKIVFKKK